MESLFHLPVSQQLSPSLSLCHYQSMPILIIQHATCRAAVSLHGGHLLAWQPTEAAPVIWLSEQAQFSPDKAIRGGVPICWPWFGKVATPSHGFARTETWQYIAHTDHDNGVTLTLQLTDSPTTRAIWHHPFTLRLTLHLGQTCELTLAAEGEFESTAALHSYFYVEDIRHVTLTGVGATYLTSPTETIPHTTTETPLTFKQAIDHIYTAPDQTLIIDDPLLKRRISVTHQNVSDIVVWNPWQAGAEAMADMPNEGYQTMLCVEAARIHQPLVSTVDKPDVFSMKIALIK